MATHQQKADAFEDALALVSLFGNCIESINLIHPAHEGLHTEEILMSQLGIQQARLIIWGDIVGVSSPPAITGITHAVPLHPGAWNPEPDKPVNFGPRDARLENQGLRVLISEALNGIVEPIRDFSRAKMLQTYGLEHYFGASNLPKEQTALVNFRLEAFREKHTLLRDVATTQFPTLSKRKHEPPKQSWAVHNQTKFAALLTLIRENVDYLIQLMDLQSRVDRSMKLDVRAMGWHPSDDIVRISRDTWKLSLMREATEDMYPEYSDAAQEALDNIMDQWKGTQGYASRPDHLNPKIEKAILHSPSREVSPERYTDKAAKKGGLFPNLRPKLVRMFSGKSNDGRSNSIGSLPVRPGGPARANSEWGQGGEKSTAGPPIGVDPPRSNSIHGDNDLERTNTYDSLNGILDRTATLESQISRHDQYRGVYRVPTKQ